MPTAVAMPKLGMTMREGRVAGWAVAPGERVERGRALLVIESEKSEVEIEATASGWLRHVYVGVDQTVPCGTLLAAITDRADEPFDADAFRLAEERVEPGAGAGPARAPRVAAAPGAVGATAAAHPGRPVTPAARARARELGLDVALVPGTGPGGRVTREDVEAWAAREQRLVDAGGGVRLEVLREGAGEAVVLVPGFGTDLSSFARQSAALRERHAVHGVHLRGVGSSDAPADEAYAVEVMAAEVAAAVALPAHVVGASLGAAVALELALRHPERVRSLALITPFLEATPRLRAVTDAWARVARDAGPETTARAVAPWLFSEALLADEVARERVVRGLAASAASVPAATLERMRAGIVAWSGTRAGGALAGIRVPTLVVVAGGDLLTPDGEAVAAAIPGARAVVVARAGHAVAVEAADAVRDALLAHLAAAAG